MPMRETEAPALVNAAQTGQLETDIRVALHEALARRGELALDEGKIFGIASDVAHAVLVNYGVTKL